MGADAKPGKAAIASRVAGRMAGKAARRNRYISSAWGAVTGTARSLSRVLRQLWHEVTGFVFLVFALVFGAAAWREYQHTLAGQQAGMSRVWLAAGFGALFAWFGVTSFWRAHRVHKH